MREQAQRVLVKDLGMREQAQRVGEVALRVLVKDWLIDGETVCLLGQS